ncbi:MAG: FIG001454: Transglutaminase-like enzymes, putative cysteine proteases, partial [uncultured Gemmatimonadetes bacterium]
DRGHAAPPADGRDGVRGAARLRGGCRVLARRAGQRAGANGGDGAPATAVVGPLHRAGHANGDRGAVPVDAVRGLRPGRRLHARRHGDASRPSRRRGAASARGEERRTAVPAGLCADDRRDGVLSGAGVRRRVRGIRRRVDPGDDGGLAAAPGRALRRARRAGAPAHAGRRGRALRRDAAGERGVLRHLPPPSAPVERAGARRNGRRDGGLRRRRVAGRARRAADAQPRGGVPRGVSRRRSHLPRGGVLARPFVRPLRRGSLDPHPRRAGADLWIGVRPALGRPGSPHAHLRRPRGRGRPLRPAPDPLRRAPVRHPRATGAHGRPAVLRVRRAGVHGNVGPRPAPRAPAGQQPARRLAAGFGVPAASAAGPRRPRAGRLADARRAVPRRQGARGGGVPAHLRVFAGPSREPPRRHHRGIPLPPPCGTLRVLLERDGGDAARRGHSRAERHRVPGGRVERFRGLPGRDGKRRPLVGRGMVSHAGLGALRSH